jgi:hypothetical protein
MPFMFAGEEIARNTSASVVGCTFDPGECPVLIGQAPLALLDLVVDPSGGKLVGNPDHGGEQMIDMF